jgi:uroporphyrinogen decarboxylase
MKPRERVILALDHKEPDRIPIDLGGSICSSIHKNAYMELKEHLGMELEELKMADYAQQLPLLDHVQQLPLLDYVQQLPLLDYVQQLPYLDEALLKHFDVDFRMVQLPAATASDLNIFEEGDYYAFIDRWGSKLYMPKEGGLYFDWVDFPIKEPTMQELDDYAWPQPDPPEYNARLRERAKHLYENTDYALVGSAVIGGGIFEQPARTMGLENFLMALVSEPEFADRLMDQITEIYIESCNNYLEQVGHYLQVFTYWDDVCGQNGWLIAPDVYRTMIKPKQRRLVEAIKRKTDARIYYHSCGAVFDLIPDLIELGFDILNPVQVSARGMDSRRLKEEYGNDITFWGGIDTQHVMPFGKPEEVADEVKRRIDDLAPGGGFVLATVHNIQAFVPPENIVTAFETALEYGTY